MDFRGKTIDYKYKIAEKITESGFSYVYAAFNRLQNDKRAVVKFVKPDASTSRKEDIIRFHNEALAVSQIDHPKIVKILDVGQFEGHHYLVMEPIEGKNLFHLLADGKGMTVQQKANLVLEIVEALIPVHDLEIYHKELNPGNIMVNDGLNGTGVRIIDFAFAQIRDYSKIRDTEEIIHVFSYLSPEQSGIIKRIVDNRSDLYSVGIIFYQLLAGQLPYKGNDPSSIIHQHIASLPEPLREIDPDIPEVLERIVFKLLEKEPDRRYQNAKSLLADLRRFLSGEIDFLPGMEERSGELRYLSDLIGRTHEYERLIRLFNGALNGKGSICLISGEFGIGKTRLIEELVSNIYYHRGTFIEGKSFAGGTKTPYGTVREALTDYVKYFSEYPVSKKQVISISISRQLGDLGEIVVKFHPMMREILGNPPPLVKLNPDREAKRFLMTISKLFLSLSVAENGIVLILDNLQWLDASTYNVLKEIARNVRNYPLLVIGLYRDSDLKGNGNLVDFISYIKANGYPLEEIQLQPISNFFMNKYVAALMDLSMDATKDLSDFIFTHSRGNPYFAVQILKQLLDEKTVYNSGGKLLIRADAVKTLDAAHSVIDVILNRIFSLDEDERTILSYAAVIGSNFDIEVLFRITKYSDEDVLLAIDKAVDLQLLQRDRHDSTMFLFTHDRIAEALYSEMKTEKLKVLHLTIAQVLEELHRDKIDQVIFEIAHHYTEAGDREKILEYALPAANRARENYANEEVIKILSLLQSILDEKGSTGNETWIKCMEMLGQTYLTTGKSDESIATFSKLLDYVKTKEQKKRAYQLMSQAFFMKGDWSSCELFGGIGLALQGETIPIDRPHVILSLIKEVIVYAVRSLFPMKIGPKAPREDNGLYKSIVNYYMVLNWMYILSDNLKFVRSVLRMLNISSLKIGTSKEQGMSIAVFASFLMILPFFKKAVKYHEFALTMRKDLNDYSGVAQSLQFLGYCYSYQGEYPKSISNFLQARERFTNIGDVWEIAMVSNGLGYDYFYLGSYDEMIKNFMEYLDIGEKISDYYGMSVAAANLCLAYAQKGDFDLSESYGARALALSGEKKMWYPHCFANINFGILMMERGNYEEAVKYFETAKKLYLENHFLKNYTVYLFSYLAEAYLELFKTGQEGIQEGTIRRLCTEALRKARRWPNHLPTALRIKAKYFDIAGKLESADLFYKKSIRQSAVMGRRFEIAKGLFEYGIFLKQHGKGDYGDVRLKAAYQIFKEIGAEAYVKRTENILGLPQSEDPSSIKMMMDKQRIFSIIRVSQDISSIMNLDELIDKVMAVSIEVTGAQRGYLFIVNDDTGVLETVARKNINAPGREARDEILMPLVEEVFRTGSPVLIADVSQDERYSGYPEVAELALKSILCIPLRYKDETKGVCYLDNSLTANLFTGDDQDFLRIIMTQAAISIENVRLYELGITDGLTKLVTHLHFQNILQKEINKSVRFKRDLSLIMIDIDHFKSINDTYGHQAGDKMLKMLSGIVKGNIRNIDTAARYGGDEIAVVLPEIGLNEAEQIAERIRGIIAASEFEYEGNVLQVTISLGSAVFPFQAYDRESLIKAADEALYQSKEQGRNKATISGIQINKPVF